MSKLFNLSIVKMYLEFSTSIVLLITFFIAPLLNAYAQDLANGWTDFTDISQTPTASTYPCLVSDTSGNLHVLWSEDVGGKTKNLIFNSNGTPSLDSRGRQINYLYDSGNTLFYTRWDGTKWLIPIDVKINPYGVIEYPVAAVDSQGILHVVWIQSTSEHAMLYYSHVQAKRADSAQEWSPSVILADPVLFAYYTVDIATDPMDGIHVIFSKIGSEPGAYVINSYDGGITWSTPIQLYSTSDDKGENDGASTMKIITDKEGRLHATWTHYDFSGNGRAIFYSQSRDFGQSWTEPFEVATWQPGWYEVDWLSVGVVRDEIHLVWEGSSQVATQVERISHDGGLTWSEPGYILPNIVGENGFADLVVDSADQLYMLVVKRGDGYSLSHGIWFTKWQNDHWLDPILLDTNNKNLYRISRQLQESSLREILRNTFTGNGIRYQKSTILNGNELFTVVVNEWDGDIWSSHTKLDALYISPKPYIQSISTPTIELGIYNPLPQKSEPTQQFIITQDSPPKNSNPITLITLSLSPSLLLIIFFLIYKRLYKQH